MTDIEKFMVNFDKNIQDFEMFTIRGNKKCKSICRKGIKKVFGKNRITKVELESFLRSKMEEAYDHPSGDYKEIYDTEPRNTVTDWVNGALVIVGYGYEISTYNI